MARAHPTYALRPFLPADVATDERARQRLLREAKTAATLDHPNICAIYEVGQDDSHSFIVLQYIEGETLAARLKRQRPDLREALTIAAQAADALSEAHARGINPPRHQTGKHHAHKPRAG